MQNRRRVYGIQGGIFIIFLVVSSLLPELWVWAGISVAEALIAPNITERFTPWLSCSSFSRQETDGTYLFLITAGKTQVSPRGCTLSSSSSSILCSQHQGRGRALISAFCSSSPSVTEWRQTKRKNNQLPTFSCLCKLCLTLIIGKRKMQIWKSVVNFSIFLKIMKVLQLHTQGTFFFHAALHQNKGLSCSSWWLGSILCLWEWEARGLRGTENLMNSLFEEEKKIQNVFQSSQERFGGFSLFRKMQLFQVKKLTLICSQLPLTKGFPALRAQAELQCTNSPTG